MKVSTTVSVKIVLLSLLLTTLLPLICEAQVIARLDRQVISIDESVRLTIEADGARNTIADIDTSALENNFSILSRSSNSSFQIINGSATAKKTWTFEIEAKHTGNFTLPPFVIGKEKSNPLTLKVTDSTPTTALDPQNLKNVFLEVTPQMDTPAYLQGQITVSVKLFLNSRMRISEASLEEPDIAHAIVQKLGDDHNYQIKKGDKTFQVIERKYAIMAEEGDAVIIPPLRFQATSLNSGNRRLKGDPFFNRFTNQGKRIWTKSQELKITLTPIPDEFNGKNWLPARGLEIMEKPDDGKELKVGEPLTRVIQIEALGLTAEQLPEIEVKAPTGSKVYLDQPEMQTKIDNGDLLHAVKRQSLAFIPSRPGTFTLPAINIKWWDVVNNRQESAILPERVIKVVNAGPLAAAAGTSANLQQNKEPADKTGEAEADKKSLPVLQNNLSKTDQQISAELRLWQTVSAVLLFILIITLLLWYRSRRRQVQTNKLTRKTALRPIANRDSIKKACLDNDPKSAQAAILDWAAANWPEESLTNLKTVARKLKQPELMKTFTDIEKALYSPADQSAWNGEKAWLEIADKLTVSSQSEKKQKDDSLPPLYRNNSTS